MTKNKVSISRWSWAEVTMIPFAIPWIKAFKSKLNRKVLVMLHQYRKQPNLVLAVTGETAPLFEEISLSWYPLWYSLPREWWPRKACCTSLMMAKPFLPTVTAAIRHCSSIASQCKVSLLAESQTSVLGILPPNLCTFLTRIPFAVLSLKLSQAWELAKKPRSQWIDRNLYLEM